MARCPESGRVVYSPLLLMSGTRDHTAGPSYRFGVFDVDPRTGELRKRGVRIRIQEKPLQLLLALLERPGEVVTREELCARLWPGVHVEFDESLNAAVKRLRQTLGDVADPPRFVETVPRRGYRLIVPVERIGIDRRDHHEPAEVGPPPGGLSRRRERLPALAALAAAVVLLAGVAAVVFDRRPEAVPSAVVEHTPADARRVTLAVLPFDDLGSSGDRAYLSDGLTEELITQLGRLLPERLAVVARTSVMRYRGVRRDIREIGTELGATHVLEGSLRADGRRVRIAVRLVDVASGTQVWSDVFDRGLGDALHTQIDVVRAVARSLAADLLPGEPEALARAGSTSGEAYDAYLRGLYALRQGTVTGFALARQEFARALADDPDYTMGLAGLAEVALNEGHYRLRRPADAYDEARTLAERALARDPDLLRARAIAAEAYHLLGDRDAAAHAFGKLRASRGVPSDALVQYAWFLHAEGRTDDALVEIARAHVLDPLSPVVGTARAHLSFEAGRLDEAGVQIAAVLARDPDYPYASYVLGLVSEARGDTTAALAAFERAHELGEGAPKYTLRLGLAYAVAGRLEDARRMLEEVRAAAAREHVPAEDLRRLESSL